MAFVDVIEVDPARRVKLKIEHERLGEMHPSELAEILADLAPAEREAIFTTLDEEVAAETLEEVDPKLQKSLLEGMDEERIADIVEEMDPGAAADLLSELSDDERSEAILEEMEPEERHEVEELLEFHEDSAAGRMTTEFVSVDIDSPPVADAVQALREILSTLMARHALQIASYTRIPWAIDAGLALFFAALNWNATRSAATPTDIAFYRRLKEIQNQSEIDRKREVS
jgi:Mg/Co/Ni transporter MgtE